MKKISFIISVRDRDRDRIERCVNSLKSPVTKEIILVDYGSKKEIREIKGVKIIRVNTDNIWNKSHALNIGIKKATGEYIATMDCDIILPKKFLQKIEAYLKEDSFIVSMNVRRIELQGWKGQMSERCIKQFSTPWSASATRKEIYQNHSANGGIQIFSRKWITKVRGYDENLVYWGGMDNDLYERGLMDGLIMINANEPIYHQEHEKKKEQILQGEEEQARANEIRMQKIKYLEEKLQAKRIVGPKTWGEVSFPQQDYFLNREREIRVGREELIKQIQNAVKKKKKKVMIDGVDREVFYPHEK